MSMAGEPIIAVKGVHKVYASRGEARLALRDINLDVYAGEFVSCVGPSGCGKSTLLNILAGLIDHTSGTVWFKGQEHNEPRREIGLMFQAPVLFDWRTVIDNVLLPVEILGLAKAQYRARAIELLDLVGLKGFETAYPRQLSGGMQQRAALSRVLVYDPEVLLLDETFGALDECTREAMNLELLRIWHTTHKTVFFFTHNISESVFLADRVVVMTPRTGPMAQSFRID